MPRPHRRIVASPHRRTLTIGAVATLHVALGYALVTGFAATIFERVDILVPTRSWKDDPPPPSPEPSVEPSQAADSRPLTAPEAKIELDPNDNSATTLDLYPQPQPTGLATAEAGPLPPEPVPSASFTPRGATPMGSPGKWATAGDCPAAALREEREGVARFRVTIGADGRVRNCEILASSGSSDLDRATCANVARRARFKPATDDTGATVSGSYTSVVKWEIPG